MRIDREHSLAICKSWATNLWDNCPSWHTGIDAMQDCQNKHGPYGSLLSTNAATADRKKKKSVKVAIPYVSHLEVLEQKVVPFHVSI